MVTHIRDSRLTAVVVVGFCAFFNVYAPQSLLPVLAQAFHASRGFTSLTVSVTTLGIALLSPLAGSLVGRVGRHALLRPALAVLVVSTFLSAFSPTLDALLGWRFLQGVALPILLAVTMAFVGQEWSGQGVGRVMALYVSANVVGGFCGRFLSGVLAEHCGWRVALAVFGLLNLAGAWAVLRYMPDSRPVPQSQPMLSLAVVRRLWAQPAVRAACLIGFNVLFGLVALFTYVTYYLALPPFNLGPAALGSIFFVYLIGGVVTPIAGRFLDRIGFRRGLTLAASVVLLGAVWTLGHTLPVVITGLALVCTGAFVSQSATTGFISEAAGADRGTAIGLYLSCYYLGGTLGAAIPGLFWAVGGWPACVFCVLVTQSLVLSQSRHLNV